MPKRIQRQRTAGWRKPDNCVIVSRPSRFGNPFTVEDCIAAGWASNANDARKICVDMFRNWLDGTLYGGPGPDGTPWSAECRGWVLAHLGDLRGKDLACFCPLDAPCHADELLRLAAEVTV